MKKIKKLFDIDKKYLKKYSNLADEVLSLEEEYRNLSNKELQAKTEELSNRLADGQTIDQIKIEAFATVREAAYRTTGMQPFKVQLMGGFSLLDGNIAEMKTGEGKTLTSTLPVYTMALAKKGVHVITVNEYLASRDAKEMGIVYDFLGITTGLNLRDLTVEEKKAAYNADVTYTTNSELGFDYLRDNMVMTREARVQRGLENAVIDEVDSILIDEARTPLIISGSEKKSHNMYRQVNALISNFKIEKDYTVNIKDKVANLTDSGIEKVEHTFGLKNLYDVENSVITHAVNQALHANAIMERDVDYVVQDNQVVIVDQFTGRTMEGRVYSDGLHQAIEAKENVTTQKETKTMATITYQNFFRLYNKLSGMTGTAKTEEEEFQKTYSMDVVQIPTNKPVIRRDNDDMLFATKAAKQKYMLDLIKKRHELGQPILIGTVAIESSEEISNFLRDSRIKHQILNAKHHEQEAEIIANAGQKGAVTIATNMAGRGTDIKLAEEVKDLGMHKNEVTGVEEQLGGLLIIGTERHESRRIDNQLRGRSGRQGDAGESFFFISFEDDLLRRFAGERAQKILQSLNTGDEPISQSILTKRVSAAQKQVESVNYDIRKTLLKYDDVLREQREVMYSQRDYVIDSENIVGETKEIINNYLENLVKYHQERNSINTLNEIVNTSLVKTPIKLDESTDILAQIKKITDAEFDDKVIKHGEEVMHEYCKTVIIKVMDEAWINHIDEMQVLRESVGLRGYGQIDPLQEYQRDGREMFSAMIDSVEAEMVKYILKGELQTRAQREAMMAKLRSEHTQTVAKRKETIVNKEEKVGPNEPCPCGSGKKYKKCHGSPAA